MRGRHRIVFRNRVLSRHLSLCDGASGRRRRRGIHRPRHSISPMLYPPRDRIAEMRGRIPLNWRHGSFRTELGNRRGDSFRGDPSRGPFRSVIARPPPGDICDNRGADNCGSVGIRLGPACRPQARTTRVVWDRGRPMARANPDRAARPRAGNSDAVTFGRVTGTSRSCDLVIVAARAAAVASQVAHSGSLPRRFRNRRGSGRGAPGSTELG